MGKPAVVQQVPSAAGCHSAVACSTHACTSPPASSLPLPHQATNRLVPLCLIPPCPPATPTGCLWVVLCQHPQLEPRVPLQALNLCAHALLLCVWGEGGGGGRGRPVGAGRWGQEGRRADRLEQPPVAAAPMSVGPGAMCCCERAAELYTHSTSVPLLRQHPSTLPMPLRLECRLADENKPGLRPARSWVWWCSAGCLMRPCFSLLRESRSPPHQ